MIGHKNKIGQSAKKSSTFQGDNDDDDDEDDDEDDDDEDIDDKDIDETN